MAGDSTRFSAGPRLFDSPQGDPLRQAIDSLRGYAYQLYASAVAWTEIGDTEELHLEVAEDYAVAAADALRAVQVKDTAGSGSVTIRTESVQAAIDGFIDLIERNPGRTITLRYLSTSPIGTERALEDRVQGVSTLLYWRNAAAGAEVKPLRDVLMRLELTSRVHTFIDGCDDEQLRRQLLRRLHWDCGQPDLEAVRLELESSLIRFGATAQRLDATEATRLVAPVLKCLLDLIVSTNARKVTKADLLRLAAEATRLTINRGDYETLIRALAQTQMPTTAVPVVARVGLLEPVTERPMPPLLAPRTALVGKLVTTARTNGMAIIIGGAGMGKTLLSRLGADKFGEEWYIADLRDRDGSETVECLRLLTSEIGQFAPRGVILDDLNELENAGVRTALARLLKTFRRRDIVCLATLHRKPSTRTFTDLDLDTSASLEVPDLERDEVTDLVISAGGDGHLWGASVHLVGGYGHPQLVQAAITGFRARGWPGTELLQIDDYNLAAADVEAERTAIRQRLIFELPDDARTLLYRLSLVVGRFDRAIAIVVGSVQPTLPLPGESLDYLVGPWISDLGDAEFRISPLVANAGEAVLSPSAKRATHVAVASAIMDGTSIDVSRGDAAYLHGLLGEAERPLLILANSIVLADQDTRKLLAKWLITLRLHRTDSVIFPANPTISRLLRLAQVLLRAEVSREDAIRESWLALVEEINSDKNKKSRESFEAVALSKLLINRSAAGIVDDWIDLILRLDAITDRSPALRSTKFLPADRENGPATLTGFLFINQAIGIRSVDELAQMFVKLDSLSPVERDKLFADMSTVPGDYSLIVNHPWLEDHKRVGVNWEKAASNYERMADLALGWGNRQLALRCRIARSIVLDEYCDDPNAALVAINQAEALLGSDLVLARARAKILYRRKDHQGNLELLRKVAADVSLDDSVERAFMLREAAISAAETGNWQEAVHWFSSARDTAAATKSKEMQPMVVGLRCDLAVAHYNVGDGGSALRQFAATFEDLGELDPESSIKAAYCHRVVRHAALWLHLRVTGRDLGDNIQTVMAPGAGSNPEPPESIKELPLGPLNAAWYLLAEAEIVLDVDVGISASLPRRIPKGGIAVMEVGLRRALIARAMTRSDTIALIDHINDWLDAMAFMRAKAPDPPDQDLMHLEYGRIPVGDPDALERPGDASTTLAAFGILTALAGRLDVLQQLPVAFNQTFGPNHPAAVLAQIIAGAAPVGSATGVRLAWLAYAIASDPQPDPTRRFEASLRFIEAAQRSEFSGLLRDPVARWICEGWLRVARRQRMSLRDGSLTGPAIEVAATSGSDLAAAARTILAAEPGVLIRPDPAFRAWLAELGGL